MIMRIPFFSLVVFLAFTSSVSSYVLAEEYPEIKPGLWESVTSSDGQQEVTSSICVDKAFSKRMIEMTNEMLSSNGPMGEMMKCTKKHSRSGDSYNLNANCKMMGMNIEIVTTYSGDFNSRFTSRTTSKTSGGMLGGMAPDNNSTSVSTYKGACPDDMKPGDMKTAGLRQPEAAQAVGAKDGQVNIGEMMEKLQNMQLPQ